MFTYGLYFSVLAVTGRANATVAFWCVIGVGVGVLLSEGAQRAVTKTATLPAAIRFGLVCGVVLAVSALHAGYDLFSNVMSGMPAPAAEQLLSVLLPAFTFVLWVYAFVVVCVWLLHVHAGGQRVTGNSDATIDLGDGRRRSRRGVR